jgi:hypothetical protein
MRVRRIVDLLQQNVCRPLYSIRYSAVRRQGFGQDGKIGTPGSGYTQHRLLPLLAASLQKLLLYRKKYSTDQELEFDDSWRTKSPQGTR